MNVKNRRTLVVGMARSGVACARLLYEEGAAVTINDNKPREQLQESCALLEDCVLTDALGEDPMTLLETVDLIVLSPGVPLTAPFAQEAKRRGIEVIGEIELGYRFAKAPIVAITGTNGKTTTTALTGEVFRAGGKHTYVLGNIGVPIAQEARNTRENDVIVAEVAGFQLESTVTFHSPCCALLNISEDHLDRFGTMERYIASKEMLFTNQRERDFAVLNADDEVAAAMALKMQGRVLYFSRRHEVEQGAFVKNGRIVFRLDGDEQELCDADELRIPGEHNLENALAAVCLALPMGVNAADAGQALCAFGGVEHRIEFVREVQGVWYINDSKGTNPDAAIKAVRAMNRPTVLMLGGSNKNSDYCPLFRTFDGKIKSVVAYGETAGQILRDAKRTGYEPVYECSKGFEEALGMARKLAASGDNVLLSPACASYDMFENFEHRGEVFKRIVWNL